MAQISAKIDAAMLAQLKDLLGARFAELVDRFIHDGERRLALLRAAVPVLDFDVIHAEAHGLKGSSRNIGAEQLGAVCDVMEQQGRVRDPSNMATLFAAVEQEFAAVCAELVTA